MMFKVKNWSSFQSYKDRRPPWVRLHKDLIDNFEFQKMSADARALLPMLWLMASEDKEPTSGMLRFGYETVSFRLRLPEKTVTAAIREIINAGFVEQMDSENTPSITDSYETVTDSSRNYHPEAEAYSEETEAYRKERKREGGCLTLTSPPDDWIAYCKDKRPDIDPLLTFETFSNYWKSKTGKDGVKLDWTERWKNWVINQRSLTNGNTKRNNGTGTKSFAAEGQRLAAKYAASAEREKAASLDNPEQSLRIAEAIREDSGGT